VDPVSDPAIRWEEWPYGEVGYLGDQCIGVIYDVGGGRLLLHCLLPCDRLTETHTPHTEREDAKAFAEHRVNKSLMAEIESFEGI
jgi:hypothetical protein